MKDTKPQFEYRPYNGHPSWQLWNVSMWLSNDYDVYKHIINLIDQYGLDQATKRLCDELKGQSTPDGAPYSKGAIRYALRDF